MEGASGDDVLFTRVVLLRFSGKVRQGRGDGSVGQNRIARAVWAEGNKVDSHLCLKGEDVRPKRCSCFSRIHPRHLSLE